MGGLLVGWFVRWLIDCVSTHLPVWPLSSYTPDEWNGLLSQYSVPGSSHLQDKRLSMEAANQ